MDIQEEINKGVIKALSSLGLVKPTNDSAPVAEQHPVLKAALAAGIDTPDKLAALSKSGDHPVLKAALAAGIDSTEKFNQLSGEALAGREALPGARAEAEKAAVAYYGTNLEGLKAAKAQIATETSFNQLSGMTERFWASSPGDEHRGSRLSEPNSPSPSNLKKEAEKVQLSSGNNNQPHDYYAQFNAQAGGKVGH